MQTAITVFCKTPDLSPVKTRLGVDIGKSFAEEFYRLSISVVKEVVHEVIKRYPDRIDVYWAVAEKEAISYPLWNSCQCIWTGEGELGERIHHIYEQLLPSYDQIIIIGSDSPQITPDYLIGAIETLAQKNMEGVFGPCRDGGFVLFGSKRLLPKSIWTTVAYSREDTLEQLEARINKIKYRYSKLTELGDVDTYQDLILLGNDFIKSGSRLLPQQKILFYWLHDILITRRIYQKERLSHIADQ